MNNYERIKAMSIEEMARFFASRLPKSCHLCTGQKMGCLREISCESGIKSYLESEVEE